jgi:hypothetical protein
VFVVGTHYIILLMLLPTCDYRLTSSVLIMILNKREKWPFSYRGPCFVSAMRHNDVFPVQEKEQIVPGHDSNSGSLDADLGWTFQ